MYSLSGNVDVMLCSGNSLRSLWHFKEPRYQTGLCCIPRSLCVQDPAQNLRAPLCHFLSQVGVEWSTQLRSMFLESCFILRSVFNIKVDVAVLHTQSLQKDQVNSVQTQTLGSNPLGQALHQLSSPLPGLEKVLHSPLLKELKAVEVVLTQFQPKHPKCK